MPAALVSVPSTHPQATRLSRSFSGWARPRQKTFGRCRARAWPPPWAPARLTCCTRPAAAGCALCLLRHRRHPSARVAFAAAVMDRRLRGAALRHASLSAPPLCITAARRTRSSPCSLCAGPQRGAGARPAQGGDGGRQLQVVPRLCRRRAGARTRALGRWHSLCRRHARAGFHSSLLCVAQPKLSSFQSYPGVCARLPAGGIPFRRALSYHTCAPLHALPQVVRVLAPDLLARLQEELEVSSTCRCACVCACLLLPAAAQLLQLAATALACRS